MAKVFCILLSALVLLQSVRMDVSDIARLDELVEHAKLHAEKYGDDFLVFLSKHYGDLQEDHRQAHQEEQREHEELPFNHHTCQHLLADFTLLGRETPAVKVIPLTDTSSNFHYQESYASIEKFDIFQPPRHT